MRISDWSSDVCSSDLLIEGRWNPEDPRDAIDREIGWSNIERSVRETELLTAGSEDGLEDVLQRYPSVRRFAPSFLAAFTFRAAKSNERSEARRVGKECVSTCRSRW